MKVLFYVAELQSLEEAKAKEDMLSLWANVNEVQVVGAVYELNAENSLGTSGQGAIVDILKQYEVDAVVVASVKDLSANKEEMLKDIFAMGISDDEIVLGGMLTEYSYKKELAGFITTYIDFPVMERDYALYTCERNARLLICGSDEFIEEPHYNILVRNVGVESFKTSNIMCVFSKRALINFGWKVIFDNGFKIVNLNNEMIGRFEYYHALRSDMGNNVYMNQPVIQRWVITKEAFIEIQSMLAYDLKQVATANVFEF